MAFVDCGPELCDGVKTHDAGAAAADVWLNQERKTNLPRSRKNFAGAIDDPRFRKGYSLRAEQLKLSRFRGLDGKRSAAVEYSNTGCFKMGEVSVGEKYSLTIPA
jgi:hypothetical protein